ncbi:MAG: nucleoside deaminase [Candidatus Omnitrophica bacterium]|nr:nucleoside deaminase [Candidatus Omnitrophota bacterium]
MTNHELYMKEAVKEAGKAFEADEVPVGAVIVHNKRVIARAHNQIKLLKDPTAHAEMIAVTQAANALRNERLNNCDIYVTIEPCPMCMGALVLARVRNLIFGAEDSKTGACGSVITIGADNKFNHKIRIYKGVLKDECASLIKNFFKNKREEGSQWVLLKAGGRKEKVSH